MYNFIRKEEQKKQIKTTFKPAVVNLIPVHSVYHKSKMVCVSQSVPTKTQTQKGMNNEYTGYHQYTNPF